MKTYLTPKEHELQIGDYIKLIRLKENMSQETLAMQSGLSLNTIKRLEKGSGSSLNTLIVVLKVLKNDSLFNVLKPLSSVNPLTMTKRTTKRLRAAKEK